MPILSTNTYSASLVYPGNDSPTWSNMNDGNCNTGTATDVPSASASWVVTDLGQTRLVESIVIGYDKNTAIANGWGVGYSVSGASIGTTKLQTSTNGTTFVDFANLPSFSAAGSPSNGLYSVSVNTSCRAIRIFQPTNYFALTEFQVIVAEDAPKPAFFVFF